jgi:hypothetical protein
MSDKKEQLILFSLQNLYMVSTALKHVRQTSTVTTPLIAPSRLHDLFLDPGRRDRFYPVVADWDVLSNLYSEYAAPGHTEPDNLLEH